MNPRKKSDDYELEHFRNAVLKGVAVGGVAVGGLSLRELENEEWNGRRLMEISLSTNTSTISRMPRAVRCDYIQRVKVFRKI